MEDNTINEMSGFKSFGFKEIVFSHIIKLLKLNCVEFRGGYYSQIETKNGGQMEIYNEDTREPFFNGVVALAQLLHHRFKKKELNSKFEEFKEKLEDLKKEFGEEGVVFGEGFYTGDEKIKLETYRIKKLDLAISLFGNIMDLLGEINWLSIGAITFGDDGEIE